ncbi:hypothetical protein LAG90_06550 [Marinilongibacter aquaticus]|uniref:DoxX family protein n=1 Tax=Marinilongibacter aquaticus TaxID=2975157 RepID=UPI0021BD0971|nr:hypothetical protein [Marinilongibacter aquaticus]UBM60302.1 hypothetical protein LAG90_06550 [Marinilongibacter aquaticus]
MKPLFVLISTFLASCLGLYLLNTQIDYQFAGKIAMASMLLFTAVGHFAFSKGMVAMIPKFLPFRPQLVILTGLFEIAFAIGLLLPYFSVFTAYALIVFFILVLPANIQSAKDSLDYQTGETNGPGLTYLWFRIPLQLFFILWVYFSAIC